MTRRWMHLAELLLCLCSAAFAQNSLLAVEQFNSPAGPLNNSGSGTGWSGPWSTQNGSGTSGYNLSSSSPVLYPGLRSSTGYASGGDNFQFTGRSVDTTSTGPFGAYLSGGIVGAPGTTLWLSLLIRKDANTDQENSITLHPGATPWYANAPLLAAGYFGASSNQGSSRYWSLKAAGTVTRSTAAVVVGQAALLVLRLDFGSAITATLYVNPVSVGGAAPAASSALTTIPSSAGFKSLAYYGGDSSSQSSIDEIRFGTSFAAVTPISTVPSLAFESFTGSAGPLNGVNTGSGWLGPWATQNGSITTPGYNVVSGSPLAYLNLQTQGNYGAGGDAYQTTGRGLDVSTGGAFSHYLSNGLIGAPGQSLWMSVLLRKDADTENENSLTLHPGTPPWFDSAPRVAIGYFGSSSDSGGIRYWSFKLAGIVYQSQVPVVVGQAALLVLRLDFASTSTVSLYVNPAPLGGTAPSKPSVSTTTSTSLSFQSLAYYGGDGANQCSIDEIRFGNNFATVTPAVGPPINPPPPQPPPAPAGMAAAGGNATVLLSWAPVTGATGYNVKRSTVSGSGYVAIATTVSTQSYSDATAVNGTLYYYVVTAVNANGESANSAEVTALPQGSAPGASPLGINVEVPVDYAVGQPFADMMKSARTPGLVGQPLNGNAPVDSQGWPTSDFEVFLADTMPSLGGRYRLSFTGQAVVTIQLTSGTVVNQTYDAPTNNTNADVILPVAAFQSLSIRFQSTQRLSTAGTNTGITNVRLMRPGYATTDTFTLPFKAIISRFRAIRFMEWAATNSQQASNWADRTAPNYAWQAARNFGTAFGSPHSGGIAWEYCIQLANETGKDMWINIPHKATDDYINQLAALVKATLNPALNVYLEFSNETWNGAYGFSQANDLHDTAVALANAGGSILTYDNVVDPSGWTYQKRLVAERTVEASNIFRSVFGASAMLTRIRPVLESQAACLSCWFQESISFIDNFYGAVNNGNSTPHPVNYFLYGGGGASYYPYLLDGGTLDNLTVDSIFVTWLPENKLTYYVPDVTSYTHWTAAFGLRNLGYEGGWSLDHTGHSDSVKDQAGNTDPRGTAVLVDGINTWNALGGDLYMYFRGSGDPIWNLTTDVTNLNTLRLQAVDTVNRGPRATLAIGSAIPGVIPASQFNATNTYGSGTGDLTLSPGAWYSFTIGAGLAGTYSVGFSAAAVDSISTLAVFVDGNAAATVSVPNTGSLSAMQDTVKQSFSLGIGLHAVRVKGLTGSPVVHSVEISQ